MFYLTMGFFFAFIVSNYWWGKSKSTSADAIFLVVLAGNVSYAIFLIGFASASGWGMVPYVICHIVMLVLLVYMSVKFGKYTSRRRQQIVNADSA